MGLHGSDESFHPQFLLQPPASGVRQGELQSGAGLQLPIPLFLGVGELHQPAAIPGQQRGYLVADGLLEPGGPVVSVYHIGGLVQLDVLLIAQAVLLYHLMNP